MNKTMTPHKVFFSGGAVTAFLLVSLFSASSAQAAITSSLDLGSTGSDVTQLQTYLAMSPNIYPSGLITGFFGPLTEAGVQRFQVAQGIVSSGTPETTGYGRVGPTTMMRINSLMDGSTNQVSWDTVPYFNDPSIQSTNTTVTISWATNEPTQGQVYWDTAQLRADEATGPRQQPYVSGTLALDSGGLQTSHSVTISNLQANTLYYYLIRGVDNVGNMSMIWPNTFRTKQ